MASPFDAGPTKAPDPFEFLKALWTPMGMPMPGLVTPTLDVGEVEKRIADLKSVENWLNLNLNVLRMTIQGLEMQKATLAAMQGMQGGMAAALQSAQFAGAAAAAPVGANPAADAWWTVLQQAQKATEQAVSQVAGMAAPRSSADTGESGKQ
jgi:hypothetical protein